MNDQSTLWAIIAVVISISGGVLIVCQTQIKALQKQIEYDAARIRDHNVCREELAELELRIEKSIARQDANHRAELKLDLTLFNQRLNDFIPNPKP